MPIIRIVELGLHNFMQLPHEFIGVTPLSPCQDAVRVRGMIVVSQRREKINAETTAKIDRKA
jgi:hypothetical protein